MKSNIINKLMVYIRLPNFKTGISPSVKSSFDPANLTRISYILSL